jgi:hypothetical protein
LGDIPEQRPGECEDCLVEVESQSETPRNRRLAIALAVTLLGFAALAYVLAALLDFTLSGSQTTDPHRRGFAAAGAFAAASCIFALWRLREVARGRARWGDAGAAFGWAIFALFVLLFVSFASRLGG